MGGVQRIVDGPGKKAVPLTLPLALFVTKEPWHPSKVKVGKVEKTHSHHPEAQLDRPLLSQGSISRIVADSF